MNILHTATLKELLAMHENGDRLITRLLQREEWPRTLTLEERDKILMDIIDDVETIYQAMIAKIPGSHIYQIEEMKEQLSLGTHDAPKQLIAVGDRYQHRHQAAIIIEVIKQDEHGLYTCSQFLGRQYLMTVHLSVRTILKDLIKL